MELQHSHCVLRTRNERKGTPVFCVKVRSSMARYFQALVIILAGASQLVRPLTCS